MKFDFSKISVFASSEDGRKACRLFADEIEIRAGKRPAEASDEAQANFIFAVDSRESRDSYSISMTDGVITVTAHGIRGLIFGFSMFLRKTEYKDGKITLVESIGGDYVPDKPIRGHQLGYRTTPNTYDAWDYEDYRRYYLDLMFFGCNTVEHIPYERFESHRNRLMKYDEQEFLVEATRIADEFDLDVSLWYPNQSEDTDEQAVERRRALLKTLPRTDIIFPPGGDPGNMYPDDFIKRCRAIQNAAKEIFPDIQMWPSAQAPHEIPNWGEGFVEELEKLPEEINGIIMGPNHAFPLDELRRKVPSKYPIRFYPDITHNVRCEYPVHFTRDDWHFALATGLSRECINPRPSEYRLLHRLTRRYVCGSVSYSEGVNDDVNKFVWSDMDFFPEVELYDSLLDYARLFFPGTDSKKIADGILRLELNWACDPAKNPTIDSTFELFTELSARQPALNGNWRFNQLLFRAECDWLLRRRRIFENSLISEARRLILSGNCEQARAVLKREPDGDCTAVRKDISRLAELLFEEIGMQLNVADYCADNWERGAVLDTIDLPVTDRQWLLNRFEYADSLPENERCDFLRRVINRNRVESDEYYFSVALNGLEETGVPVQEGEIYMNFQGDRPNVNNGSLPTCMFKVYDNLSFRCKLGGFAENTDYKLTITFVNKTIPLLKHHRILANGKAVYDGPQFGGEANERFDHEMLAPGFVSATYPLGREFFENGCVELEFREDNMGVMFSEFRITRA